MRCRCSSRSADGACVVWVRRLEAATTTPPSTCANPSRSYSATRPRDCPTTFSARAPSTGSSPSRWRHGPSRSTSAWRPRCSASKQPGSAVVTDPANLANLADLADLVDLMPDAVLRLDGERRIVAANAAAVSLTGFPVDRLTGKSCAALLDPRGRNGKSVWDDGWHRSALLRSVKQLP